MNDARLLLQEFHTMLTEYGDRLTMTTPMYRASLIRRIESELQFVAPEETAYKAALEDVLKPFYYYRRSGSTPQVLTRDLQDAVMKHAAIIDTLDLGSPPQSDEQ